MHRALLLVAGLLLAACSPAETQGSRIELTDCGARVFSNAKCGTFEVLEDRASKNGRRIPLNIVVLPARGETRHPDPVFYFDGGPGAGATGAAAYVSRLLGQVNQSRDLVFVDVRGTGRSGPLTCDRPPDGAPLQRYFDDFLSDEYVRACLARQTADVRFYTQPIAMDDVEEVRRALGYQRINLFGSSGGTRQEQIYMRRHPASVRSVVMHGVHPMDGELPLSFSQAMEVGVRWLIEACAAEPSCREPYPSLARDWEESKRRFDAGPVDATVRDPRTGRQERVRLSRGVYADGVRHMLYNLDAWRQLAARIHRAAGGDYDAFADAELAQVMRFARVLSHGFFIASTCAEDIRFIDENDIRQATHGTFLGDYRVRRQQAACRIWPRGEGVDDDFQSPVTTNVPVLLISGQADVATPLTGAERVAQALPNARHIIFPNQGHTFSNPACASRLIANFIDAAGFEALDLGCVNATARPGPPE